MKKAIGILLLTLFFERPTAGKICKEDEGKESPRTTTTHGVLIGTTYTTYSGRPAFAFYGVPYAKPPVGNLRFEPPQPMDPWRQPRLAKCKRNMCVQPVFQFPIIVQGHEDCLFMDIYTPYAPKNGTCEKYMPLLFFIHPSGYLFGSGANHEPWFIMSKYDLVFVSINYRLGPLGYFSTGDLVVPGNNGQKDQVLALKWIKENAKSFCGDPDQITIAGSSAGGVSVGVNMWSPLTKGLFNKAIVTSGSPYFLAYTPLVVDFGRIMAEQLFCPTDDSRAMVNCLKTRSAYIFWYLDAFNFRPFILNPLISFALVLEPCHEGAYITKLPEVYLEQEEIYDVPTLSMLSQYEGLIGVALIAVPFAPILFDIQFENIIRYIYNFNLTTPQNLIPSVAQKIDEEYYKPGLKLLQPYAYVKSLTDRFFKFSTYHYLLDLSQRISSKVYHLESTYRGEDSSTTFFSFIGSKKNYGAGHTDVGLLAIYDGLLEEKHPLNPDDEDMMYFMTDVYYSFMLNGEPSVAKQMGWTPIPRSGDTINYLLLNNAHNMKSKSSNSYGRPEFWGKLPYYPNRGFPYADSCNKSHQIQYHKG